MALIQWYKAGTVSANNGDTTFAFSGAALLSNAEVGQAVKMPDGRDYEIIAIGTDNSVTVPVPGYLGSNVVGGVYAIVPIQGYNRAAALAIASLLGVASALLGLTPANGSIIQWQGGNSPAGAYTTVSPAAYFTTLSNNVAEVDVAGAALTDIGSIASPKVRVTGTPTITSFGAVPNCLRFIRFGSAGSIANNSVIITHTGQSVTFAAGDTAILTSDNSSTPIWTIRHFNRVAGNAVHAAGTAAVPAVAIGGSNDGWYQPAAHTLAATINGTERLRVTAIGVGIGTTTPGALLHMFKDDNTWNGPQVLLENPNSGAAAQASFAVKSDAGSGMFSVYGSNAAVGPAVLFSASSGLTNGMIFATFGASPIAFLTNSNGVTNERLRITSAGSVGINTTAPTSKFQVVGLPSYSSNALALAAGLTAGAFYTNGDNVCAVH